VGVNYQVEILPNNKSLPPNHQVTLLDVVIPKHTRFLSGEAGRDMIST